jgi:hypothetical protein
MTKVIPSQMPPPRPQTLLQPVGDLSPMGLLWLSMGAAPAYQAFAGAAETLAGLLILWRRTATLGALLAAGVMANVVMLNLCYDVPVKLFSSHLLLIALLLVAPELPRLWRAVTGKAVAAAPSAAPERPWLRRAETALVAGCALLVAGRLGPEIVRAWRDTAARQAAPLSGVWDVEGSPRFKRANLSPGAKAARLIAADGTAEPFTLEMEASGRWFTLTSKVLPTPPRTFLPTAAGVFESDWPEGTVRLKKIDTSQMRLLTRGFHFISEAPFNR